MPVNDDVRLISNVLPTAVLGLRAPQQWTQPSARLEDLLGLPRRTMQHVQGAKQSFVPSPTDVHSPTAATRRKPTTDQRRNVPGADISFRGLCLKCVVKAESALIANTSSRRCVTADAWDWMTRRLVAYPLSKNARVN